MLKEFEIIVKIFLFFHEIYHKKIKAIVLQSVKNDFVFVNVINLF